MTDIKKYGGYLSPEIKGHENESIWDQVHILNIIQMISTGCHFLLQNHAVKYRLNTWKKNLEVLQ